MSKRKKKIEKPRGNTWIGYFPRITKDKTKYNRKKAKEHLRRRGDEV